MTRSDEELLRAHLAGDRTAFIELVERYQSRFWSVARRQLDSLEDADEVVSDAFTRAHQAAARFRAEASVQTWLMQILTNACRDRHRRNRSRPCIPVSDADLAGIPVPRDPIADSLTRLDLEEALRQLPPEQRLAIIYVDVEGYSTAETAEALGVPVGTVKSRCARGRARLQELLGVSVVPAGEEP